MKNMYRKRMMPFVGISLITSIILWFVSLKLAIATIVLATLVWFSEPIVQRSMHRFLKGGTYE